MKEVDAYGKVNPFQNPSIGRIPDVKILSDGSYASNEAVYIDQNLLGPQGLIGRTLYVAVKEEDGTIDFAPICWVIGLAPAPPTPWNGEKPKVEVPYQKPIGKKLRPVPHGY